MTPTTQQTALPYQWTRTDIDGASECLRLVRLDSGRTFDSVDLDGAEYPYLVQITTGPDEDDDFVGLYDLDGERVAGAHGWRWECVPASEDVPAEVITQIECGFETGNFRVTRTA